MDVSKGGSITSSVGLIPFYPLKKKLIFTNSIVVNFSAGLWNKLNVERADLSVEICYCSLLDNCYLTNGKGNNKAIEVCPVIIEKR